MAEKSAKYDAKKAKQMRAYRGWLYRFAYVNQVLSAWQSPFLVKRKTLTYCPQRLMWPDMDDCEGLHGLIDAVIDKDLDALKTMQNDQWPEYNLGLKDYIRELQSLGGTFASRDVVFAKLLRGGTKIEIEKVTSAETKPRLRAVIRRGPHEIASKFIDMHTLQEHLSHG